MKTDWSTKRHPVRLYLAFAAMCVVPTLSGRAPASTTQPGPPGGAKDRTPAELEAGFRGLVSSHPADAHVEAVRKRLDSLDEAAGLITKVLQELGEDAMAGLLGEISSDSASKNPPKKSKRMPGSGEIYEVFRGQLTGPMPDTQLNLAERAITEDYLDAAFAAVGDRIAGQAKISPAMGEETRREIQCLCALAPLWRIEDERWSQEHTAALPSLIRTPAGLRVLEEFCLRQERPLTAMQIAQAVEGKAWPHEKQLDYLLRKGQLVAPAGGLRFAMAFHKAAVAIRLKHAGQDASLRPDLDLAKSYDQAGHSSLAAGVMQSAMQGFPRSPDWGSVAVMRMVYLCKAKQWDTACQEFPTYDGDQRCRAHASNLLYLGWLAHARGGLKEKAEEIKGRLIREHPGSILCADMHFDSAVQAIQEGRIQEAQRLLEIIEYRFPSSSLVARAKELKKGLALVESK